MWPQRSHKRLLSSVSAYNGAMQKQVGQVSGQAQDISQARELERKEKWQKKQLKLLKVTIG